MASPLTTEDVIALLGLEPHPEGGHYRQTWRDEPASGRGVGTAIYYLLGAGERSHWHRVDADEIWLFHTGAALRLRLSPDDTTPPTDHGLGVDLAGGQAPQVRVPAGWWQSAESTGEWTLVGCIVSPAFDFAGFELAPSDFEPGSSGPREASPGDAGPGDAGPGGRPTVMIDPH